jgi:hypothetical protein
MPDKLNCNTKTMFDITVFGATGTVFFWCHMSSVCTKVSETTSLQAILVNELRKKLFYVDLMGAWCNNTCAPWLRSRALSETWSVQCPD